MTDRVEELLRRLAAGDETTLRPLLALEADTDDALGMPTRMLVRLAALLAVDAPTTSLRWAVEMASATVGTARVVAAAPRLALAIGYDIEQVGWDGS